jgi:hypothetical protein
MGTIACKVCPFFLRCFSDLLRFIGSSVAYSSEASARSMPLSMGFSAAFSLADGRFVDLPFSCSL